MNHTRFLLGTSFFTTSSCFSIMLKVAATACGTTKLDQHGKNILPGIGRNVARYTETVYIHAYHIQYRKLRNRMNIHIHSMNSFKHQSIYFEKSQPSVNSSSWSQISVPITYWIFDLKVDSRLGTNFEATHLNGPWGCLKLLYAGHTARIH